VWPCPLCHPEAYVDGTVKSRYHGRPWTTDGEVRVPIARLANRAPDLFEIAEDVVDLHKTKLISHPLVRTLAMRAQEIIRTVMRYNHDAT
jgi:hypothetical protein